MRLPRLNRLAKLAHASETLMGQYRDGAPVTVGGVTVILASIDRIKEILAGLDRDGTEPPGSYTDLIGCRCSLWARMFPPLGRDAAGAMPGAQTAPNQLPPVQDALDELERAWRAASGADLGVSEVVAAAEVNARGRAGGGRHRGELYG